MLEKGMVFKRKAESVEIYSYIGNDELEEKWLHVLYGTRQACIKAYSASLTNRRKYQDCEFSSLSGPPDAPGHVYLNRNQDRVLKVKGILGGCYSATKIWIYEKTDSDTVVLKDSLTECILEFVSDDDVLGGCSRKLNGKGEFYGFAHFYFSLPNDEFERIASELVDDSKNEIVIEFFVEALGSLGGVDQPFVTDILMNKDDLFPCFYGSIETKFEREITLKLQS